MAGQKNRIKVFSMGRGEEYGAVQRSDKSPADLTRDLAEANGFDLSYLSENSRGELGQGQGSMLVRNLVGPILIFITLLGVLIFQLNSQGILKRISMGTPLGTLISDLPQSMLIIGGIFLAGVLVSIYLLVTTLLDMFGGTVAVLEGPGWKKITTSTDDDGSTTTRTYYVIADRKFTVKSGGFAVLENGRNYRAYFSPRRKILVNIEALD